jgi:eukaryotic-like serine/threonine-protein kinase
VADSNTERDPLEVLATEFTERLRKGEQPSISAYIAKYPDLAEDIETLFPTIVATERLKVSRERSSDGRASLGAAALERLGDFRIIREIGRGGMGVVFEAEQESLGRRVAIKVLPRPALLDPKHLRRFHREARIAANLHHTNIAEVFGVGEQNGFHYYVMQYIHGVGLDAVIARLAKTAPSPPTTSTETELVEAATRELLGQADLSDLPQGIGPQYGRSVARVGLQAAEALHYAHTQGTLHRDIKPANLLLDTSGVVWLTDFGLAKTARSENVSLAGDVVGTLRYMAPERFRGQVDERSDIYSLGLTLYELLVLEPAYAETDRTHLIQQITHELPLPPRRSNPQIPRDLETIILKASAQDASQRYASAGELADDLRRFLEDRPIQARRASSMERLGRWCRRNQAVAGLAGTTLLLLVLIAVVACVGYVRTRNALRGEADQRAMAQANADLAVQAIDRIFERFSPKPSILRPQLTLESTEGKTIEVPSPPVLSKEAAGLLEELLPFYDRLAQQTNNEVGFRARTAEANRRVATIRQRLGQFEQAVKAYQQAITIFAELDAHLSTHGGSQLEIASIQNELGRMYQFQRQFAEARQCYHAALQILQSASDDALRSAEVRYELARTYYLLGTRERPLPDSNPPGPRPGGPEGRLRGPDFDPPPLEEDPPGGPTDVTREEQRSSLTKAVALLGELAQQQPANPQYQHLLALCYLEGAPLGESRGPGPRGGAERAIEILESLVRTFPDVPDYAYDLSEAHAQMHVPRPPIPPEDQEFVERHFRRAADILDSLVARHPNIPEYLTAQAHIHHKLGAFFRQTDRFPEAEQSLQKAVAIQSSLAGQFPNAPYYKVWLGTFQIALGDVLIRSRKLPEALPILEEATGMLTRLLTDQPEMTFLHGQLARGYSNLAIALRQSGQREAAAQAEQRAQQERSLLGPLP